MEEKKYNQYLYRSSKSLHKGLAELQEKVNDLYRVEELEDYLDVPDSPIEYIQSALGPLTQQVNDMLDYAETVTGKMELDLAEVDIYALMDSVLTIADQLVDSKGPVVVHDMIAEGLPTIEGDAARLTQALLNYIHNAVKFTDEGTVTIRVSKEPQDILFEVTDSGIGIAEKDQELIFEPFETVLEDQDDPRLGLGIGLKIVEHIIDLHDGETWFDSKIGIGSSFYFTVPL